LNELDPSDRRPATAKILIGVDVPLITIEQNFHDNFRLAFSTASDDCDRPKWLESADFAKIPSVPRQEAPQIADRRPDRAMIPVLIAADGAIKGSQGASLHPRHGGEDSAG